MYILYTQEKTANYWWSKVNRISKNNLLKKKSKPSEIKFKTATLKISLCDYSDAYILVKGIVINK